MPFQRKKAILSLSTEERGLLERTIRSRTEPVRRVERAQMLLLFADGLSVAEIAERLRTNRPKVERCVKKALEFGVQVSLEDLQRSGKPRVITPEAKAWLVSVACQKPKELGYSYEVWTTNLLAKHVREHCTEQGHPSLSRLARGTVSKVLASQDIHPHKVAYNLERRDPEFERKMAQVLAVYQEVQWMKESSADDGALKVVLSYDEKPDIQAIGVTAPDLPPVPGKHPYLGRNHEYVRHGTLSLLAGIDLLNGRVHGIVEERHRSREFVSFLKMLNEHYPSQMKIQIVLDNHSAHTSKETREYLDSVPNRFEFVFTPKHASWLNLVESFFAKMTKTMLRHIRVSSKLELKERIEQFLNEVNETPVVFRWKYKMEPSENR